MQAGNVTLNQPTVGYGHLLKLLAAALVLGFAVAANQAMDPKEYGFLVLLPIAAVLGCALLTHRSIEALLFGSLVGFVMLDPTSIFQKMIDTHIAVLSDDITAWVITITFLVGGLIALLNFSGGTQAFGAWVGRHAKSRAQTLMATWFMGLVIFVDDYLNALAVSSSMKILCDKFKVSRQMLAYVVDSTSAPMCVLVPVSTWAVFLVGLFEANKVFGEGQGFAGYLQIIPYIFYAWAAVLLVPLVGMGLIPAFGSMKTAEANAARGVVTAPVEELEVRTVSNPKISNFVLPLAAFMAGTWIFDYNTLYGIVFALVVTVPLFMVQKLGSIGDLVDRILEGFSGMIQPMTIVIASFVLQRVNDELGLSPFILDQVVPYMNAALLPAITFIVLSVLAFATGSFWGIYAIALPVIFPLAQAVGADMNLTLGALVSAGVFGSHACFFGDATVITAKGAGCTPHSHAMTQLPYALIAGAVTTALFIGLA